MSVRALYTQLRVAGARTRHSHALFALLAGGLSALGFAPSELWAVTVLAFAWMLHSIARSESWMVAWKRGWLFGFAHFATGLSWLPPAFSHQDAIPQGSGWPALALLASYLAIYPASAFAAARLVGSQDTLKTVLLSGSFWIFAEWLRGTMLSGFPWNPIGLIWLDVPHLSQTPANIGAIGLSGLTILLAGSLTLVSRRRFKAAAIAASLCAILVAVSNLTGPSPLPSSTPVRGTIVQPNISQDQKWRPQLAQRHLATHMALSGPPGTASQPRLLFWPETAVPYPIEQDVDLRRHLASVLGPRDILLTGGTAKGEDADGQSFVTNSVFVLDSSGRLLFRYDKSHLVPFGEYLPFEPLLSRLGLGRLVEGTSGFKPGTGPVTLKLPDLPSVGPAICYEIVFPSAVAAKLSRPTFLFNPSNDAWFGSWGPPQHLAHARMRSIEEGLPTVRATTSGISAMIGPDGRILEQIPDRRRGYIDLLLPKAYPPTLFSRAGNFIPLVLAIMLALSLYLRGWVAIPTRVRCF